MTGADDSAPGHAAAVALAATASADPYLSFDALRARCEMLQTIIDSIPALIAYWDADLVCRFANAAHAKRFGIPVDKMIGMTAPEVLGEAVSVEVLPLMNNALRGQTVHYTKPFPQGDGSVAWSDTTYTPDWRDGRVHGFYVLRYDVTERKRLEGELDQARVRAQQVSAILARLLDLTSSVVGEAFLERTVQAMSELLHADIVFVARVMPGLPLRARVLAAWRQGRPLPPWDYNIDDRPSRLLYRDSADDPPGARRHAGSIMIPSGVAKLFPLPGTLPSFEGYLGVPILDADGQPAAQLIATFIEPLAERSRQDVVFETARFFAARIRTELDRLALEQARAAASADLYDEKERLRVTLHAIGDGVIVTDPHERVTLMNATAERLTGWTAADATGAMIETVAPLARSHGRGPLPPPAREAIAGGVVMTPSVDAVILRPDGSSRAIDASASPIFGQDGSLIGSITVLHDVTEARALLGRVQELAHFDALTGLPNRVLFQDRLAQTLRLSERAGERFALLFLDLDRFKHVNDTLGHAVGDQLLREVATRLQLTVRESDTVARLGGDEFVVILGGLHDSAFAAAVARNILGSIARINEIGGHDIDVSFSVGIAVYPDDGLCAEDLLRHADAAMYQAKDAGRNTHAFFDPEMERAAQRRNRIRLALARALELDQFRLLFQPKVNLASSRIVGAEALVRWHIAAGEIISPLDFIPVAEETGAILPIGLWVVNEACRHMRHWRAQGLPPIRVAINVSMRNLRDPGFVAALYQALDDAALPPDALEIEITETMAMTDSERPLAVLAELRRFGVHIAIDDFGTGFSSLARLQQLPADTIKIDQAFVRKMLDSEDDMILVRTIISMATALRKHTVAEGVETEAQRALLRRLGCLEAQGYLFSRPVEADAFAALLAQVTSPVRA